MTMLVVLSPLKDTVEEALASSGVKVKVVSDLKALADLNAASGAVLLSYGAGEIVPPATIARFDAAYNLHAASPDYPGRDPHHFAVYEGASRYGATLHRMIARVDAGEIVDVEMFAVPPSITPRALLRLANDAALRILQRVGPRLARGEPLAALPGAAWGGVKRSRQDFLDMCRIDPAISAEEFDRLYRAFDGEGFDNLRIHLHGRTFRIQKDD